jgi:hypothetical protein
MRAHVAIPLMMLCLGASGFAQESSAQEKFAKEKLPTGTLRATYIATNPVQAFVDQKTAEVRGPAADLAREIAKHLAVPVKITGVAGPAAVIDSLKKGEADIGFLAFDPLRAAEVDFSQVCGAEHLHGAGELFDQNHRGRRPRRNPGRRHRARRRRSLPHPRPQGRRERAGLLGVDVAPAAKH